jgi:hypothetical protein
VRRKKEIEDIILPGNSKRKSRGNAAYLELWYHLWMHFYVFTWKLHLYSYLDWCEI